MLLEDVQKYQAQNGKVGAFFRNPIGHGKTGFSCKILTLKHICFGNDKMKAENHRMISLNCAKTRSMKFSAELMMNKAAWPIIEYIYFERLIYRQNKSSIASRQIFFA